MNFIIPDWQVSKKVKAIVTTRVGGVSQPPFDTFNLATHVGDLPENVKQNRQMLLESLDLPCEPQWLEQVHGTDVIEAGNSSETLCGDACYTNQAGKVCTVLTADCLPVFLAAEDGGEVAVAHAGWKGLLKGVIENTVSKFEIKPSKIHVWLGPAIGPEEFEVGDEVRQAFLREAGQSEIETVKKSFLPALSPTHTKNYVASLSSSCTRESSNNKCCLLYTSPSPRDS